MKKKILLVDDDEDQLALTGQILGRKGYEVITAQSGLIALDMLSRWKSQIFAVVLDILMPSADGRKLAVKIKAMAPGTKIILFSNYGFKGRLKEWGVKGIDYVMKNDEGKLITLINEYEAKLSKSHSPKEATSG